MTRLVLIEAQVTLACGRFLDDPVGLGEVFDAIDALAEEPFPEQAVPFGKVFRLTVGTNYRIMYEVTEAEIKIGYVTRII